MIRRKLKSSELLNTKTKYLPSFQKKSKYLSPCETSHKKKLKPQNNKKKIEYSGISK